MLGLLGKPVEGFKWEKKENNDGEKQWVSKGCWCPHLICGYRWHFGEFKKEYMHQQEEETESQTRQRENYRMRIEWFMLFPGARPLIIWAVFGNAGDIVPFKPISVLQMEKSQIFRATAAQGLTNMVTATFPNFMIGYFIGSRTDPLDQFLLGAASMSLLLSLYTMRYGVIDKLVYTIDEMDTALTDHHHQQSDMKDIVEYGYRHFLDLRAILVFVEAAMDHICSCIADRDDNQSPTVTIDSSDAHIAMSECLTALESHVCEDEQTLFFCNSTRKLLSKMVHSDEKVVIEKKFIRRFHSLVGCFRMWMFKYAEVLELTLPHIGLSIDSATYKDVKETLEQKKRRETHVNSNLINRVVAKKALNESNGNEEEDWSFGTCCLHCCSSMFINYCQKREQKPQELMTGNPV